MGKLLGAVNASSEDSTRSSQISATILEAVHQVASPQHAMGWHDLTYLSSGVEWVPCAELYPGGL